jgi:hypothetical protein
MSISVMCMLRKAGGDGPCCELWAVGDVSCVMDGLGGWAVGGWWWVMVAEAKVTGSGADEAQILTRTNLSNHEPL